MLCHGQGQRPGHAGLEKPHLLLLAQDHLHAVHGHDDAHLLLLNVLGFEFILMGRQRRVRREVGLDSAALVSASHENVFVFNPSCRGKLSLLILMRKPLLEGPGAGAGVPVGSCPCQECPSGGDKQCSILWTTPGATLSQPVVGTQLIEQGPGGAQRRAPRGEGAGDKERLCGCTKDQQPRGC